MKASWLALFVCAGFTLPLVAQSDYQTKQRNVVKIVAYHGEAFETGTGIIAGTVEGGVDILTDLHVIAPITGSSQQPDPPSKIDVFFSDDRATPVAAAWSGTFDRDLDLTTVRVTSPAIARQRDALPDLCFVDDGPKDSERVSVIGHGLQDWQMLIGLNAVLATNADTDYKAFLISTTGLDRGFSGGPVFNADGCVIGVVRQLSARQAIVTKIRFALPSATALGIRVDVFRGSKPIDTVAKAQAYDGLARALRTYLFNAGAVLAFYDRSGPIDRTQLAQIIGQYNTAYSDLFNDREKYRLAISTFWGDRRVRPFDDLLDNLDTFHRQFIFGKLDPFVNILRSRSLTDSERRSLDSVLQSMHAALPSLEEQRTKLVDDLRR